MQYQSKLNRNIFGFKTFYSSHPKRKLDPDLIDPKRNLIKKFNQKLCLETNILRKPECNRLSNFSFANIRLNKKYTYPNIHSAFENYININKQKLILPNDSKNE